MSPEERQLKPAPYELVVMQLAGTYAMNSREGRTRQQTTRCGWLPTTQSHAVSTRPHHEVGKQPPTAEEVPGEQPARSRKENPSRLLSDHGARAKGVHEHVPKNKRSTTRQGARRPQQREPTKKGPRRGPSVNSLCTLRGPQAPEQGKHVPEVGLEPHSSPCKHWELQET